MRVIGLSLLEDNYAWLLCDEASSTCAVVDPSEAAPILAFLREEGLTLGTVLATHHHFDHVGGIEELVAAAGPLEVVCSAHDLPRVPGATRGVEDGEVLELLGHEVRCLAVPGHTLGAVAYHFPREAMVFTGDTLFAGGCGRLFEGEPGQMLHSLLRLAALPEDTRVYCGHEYTVQNLAFAAHLEPDNEAVAARLEGERSRRIAGWPTVPSTVRLERMTNPFLRVDEPGLRRVTGQDGPVAVFAELRRRKDHFRG